MRTIWNYQNLALRGQCAFCSSANSKEVAIRKDGLRIHECMACGLAYVDPRPTSDQLRNYYDAGYFSGKKDFFRGRDYCEERDQALTNGHVTGYDEIVSNSDLSGKAILDIGCASGTLLKLLSMHNPAKLTGIDIAEHPVAYGKSRYGLDLRCTSLEAAGFPAASFDLILMIDLIEHIEELPDFLQEVTRVLRSGGYIFLLTPNYRAFSRARSRWICLHKDFEHLQYLSPFSLAQLAAKVGLKVVRWWTRGLPVFPSPYPRLHKMGLHRVLYPRTSLSNVVKRLKYAPLPIICPSSGHDLCAIVKKEVYD